MTDQIFKPNPGKSLEVDVNGKIYLRLPVKTHIIKQNEDLLVLLQKYVSPHLLADDLVFVSEKVLAVTQGRVINMNDIKPSGLARFLARKIRTNYGTKKFKGFGHGTPMAMQLFIEEAGLWRVLFAAAASALTRPLGIKGLFYLICGKQAKSIDCPMSFTILEYAHYAKLAPLDPKGFAEKAKEKLRHEVVILDANYQGAFSLAKTSAKITEKFIRVLFRDNPLGQSDEMTPFCIVRVK